MDYDKSLGVVKHKIEEILRDIAKKKGIKVDILWGINSVELRHGKNKRIVDFTKEELVQVIYLIKKLEKEIESFDDTHDPGPGIRK